MIAPITLKNKRLRQTSRHFARLSFAGLVASLPSRGCDLGWVWEPSLSIAPSLAYSFATNGTNFFPDKSWMVSQRQRQGKGISIPLTLAFASGQQQPPIFPQGSSLTSTQDICQPSEDTGSHWLDTVGVPCVDESRPRIRQHHVLDTLFSVVEDP